MTLFVTFALVGCAKRPEKAPWPAQVTSIENFSESGKTSIRNAIIEMNEKTGKDAISESGPDSNFKISIVMVDPTEGTQTRAGFATVYDDHCEVQISSLLFQDDKKSMLESVVWHELGHCAGLNHDIDPGSIMYKTTAPFSTYTGDALAKFYKNFISSAGL